MEQKFKSKRAYAFFRSKVLSMMMTVMVLCLLMMGYSQTLLLPSICGATALAIFVGYSVWFWVKKPKSIITSEWLSNLSGIMFVYWLIISAVDTPGPWWYIVPMACSVVILFISLVNHKDKFFEM